jgi:hypothetical protein
MPCQRWGPRATCRDGHWVVACRCFAGAVAAGHGHGRTILLSRLVVGPARSGASDPNHERGSWGLFARGEGPFGASTSKFSIQADEFKSFRITGFLKNKLNESCKQLFQSLTFKENRIV